MKNVNKKLQNGSGTCVHLPPTSNAFLKKKPKSVQIWIPSLEHFFEHSLTGFHCTCSRLVCLAYLGYFIIVCHSYRIKHVFIDIGASVGSNGPWGRWKFASSYWTCLGDLLSPDPRYLSDAIEQHWAGLGGQNELYMNIIQAVHIWDCLPFFSSFAISFVKYPFSSPK